MIVILPFPDAGLVPHAKGTWRGKAALTAKHREWARNATMALPRPTFPEKGDIAILIRFVPPHAKFDRFNMPAMVKAYADGLADGLKQNDRRFLPSFEYHEPEKPGRIEILVG